MAKIKTSELIGQPLDWAVCEVAGLLAAYKRFRSGKAFLKVWGVAKNAHLHPSTNWSQGGPIIEREKIDTAFTEDGWYANMYNRMTDSTEGYTGDTYRCGGEGPTQLIAAMRCFVASRLGDEVDVPEELL